MAGDAPPGHPQPHPTQDWINEAMTSSTRRSVPRTGIALAGALLIVAGMAAMTPVVPGVRAVDEGQLRLELDQGVAGDRDALVEQHPGLVDDRLQA